MRYLGVWINRSGSFLCELFPYSLNRVANGVLSNVCSTTSEELFQLIKSQCLPVLLYSTVLKLTSLQDYHPPCDFAFTIGTRLVKVLRCSNTFIIHETTRLGSAHVQTFHSELVMNRTQRFAFNSHSDMSSLDLK